MAEDSEQPDPPPSSTEPREAEDESRGIPSWVKIGAVFSVLAGAVAVLMLGGGGADDAFVYSKLVHEVASEPDRFEGQQLRVEGDLEQGSVKFREDPCEWRFVLTKQGEKMPVRFSQCVVPDTFRDDMGISVVVEGEMEDDGTFVASQVIPRCPSKYDPSEHDKLKESGKDKPHGEMPEAS
ncbi:MAG: cytochrome c maturation protein CcmE [Polyangiales bacterium]